MHSTGNAAAAPQSLGPPVPPMVSGISLTPPARASICILPPGKPEGDLPVGTNLDDR